MNVKAPSFPIADRANETLVRVAQDSRLWIDVAFAIRGFLAGDCQSWPRDVVESSCLLGQRGQVPIAL